MLKILKFFFVEYYKLFIVLVSFLIFEGLVNLLTTLSIIPLTDFILDPSLNNPSKITNFIINIYTQLDFKVTFWSLSFVFILFNFFKVLNFVFIRYLILRIKYFITFKIYEDLVRKFLEADWVFFSRIDRGKFFNSFTKEMDVIGNTIGNITTQITNAFQLILYLSVPFYLNFYLTGMIIIFIIIFCLPFLFLSKFSYFYGKRNLETANFLIQSVNEIIQGAKTILSYERQINTIDNFKNKFKKHISFTIKSQIVSQALPQFFMPCAIFSVVVSVGFISSRNLNISELSGVMWSLIAIIPIFLSFLRNKAGLASFIPSYEQLSKFKNDAIKRKREDGKNLYKSFSKNIKFSNIHFKYDNSNILNSINTCFNKNEITAIVGRSGSGKSTLIDLILKISYPSLGSINIDDQDFKTLDGASLRNKIGFVAQDNFLFNTTIKNNLLWATPNASNEEIENALKISYSYDFVNNLPNKTDTHVGDRGEMLSGGERQRLALARAIIKKPDILILDEATSALDTISENHIIKNILDISNNMTIILCTHKLSLLKYSHKIVVMDNGRIIEEGKYNQLIADENSALSKMINNKIIED